jgi:hypothetical protein
MFPTLLHRFAKLYQDFTAQTGNPALLILRDSTLYGKTSVREHKEVEPARLSLVIYLYR